MINKTRINKGRPLQFSLTFDASSGPFLRRFLSSAGRGGAASTHHAGAAPEALKTDAEDIGKWRRDSGGIQPVLFRGSTSSVSLSVKTSEK